MYRVISRGAKILCVLFPERVSRRGATKPKAAIRSLIDLANHLKVELIDLPFAEGRRFRVRVNGKGARKVPVASRSAVLRQLRTWWVAQ
jgi:hypothetical protein